MLKLVSAIVILSGSLLAQAVLTLNCPTTAAVGSLTCPISLATPSGTVALQFTVVVPPQASGFIVIAAPSVAAQKSLTCAVNGMCLLYGGQSSIPAGQIATIVFQIPKTAKGASLPNCQNCITVGISSSIAVDANAGVVASAVNPSSSVSISNTCDVTGDGQNTAADIAAIVSQIQKSTPAVVDLNSDGALDVQDLQIEIIAVLTGVCNAK